MMNLRQLTLSVASAAVFAGAFAVSDAAAQDKKEQFFPMLVYRTGPYAAGGTGIFGGMEDYFALLNLRDGGIGGVTITWEECDTGYNSDRGVECYERLKNNGPTGASMVHPLSTGITYRLIERATVDKIPVLSVGYGRTDASDGRVFPYIFPLITNYWSQNTAKIKFIGMKEGGMDKLKGKKIANLYHKSSYGLPLHRMTAMSDPHIPLNMVPILTHEGPGS
ncbi:MAG: ABC transporter substrate-binding protein [Dehalococcoidia bacterium]